MRNAPAEPILLHANDDAVQTAQRQTTTGFLLAILATVGIWVWRYATLRHLNLPAIEMTLGFYAAGRIVTYFMCRLDPTLKWIGIGCGVLILAASALFALHG